MRGSRGGARKKRETQEIRRNGDQSSPPPPTLSRYPKRSSRNVAPQLFASPSSSRARRPRSHRVLKQIRLSSKPEDLQMQHMSEMENVKPSPLTIFPTHSAPPSQHEMVLDGISQPPTESEAVSHDKCVEVKIRQYLSPSTMTVRDGLLNTVSNDEQDKMESTPMSRIKGILKKRLQDKMVSARVEEGVSRKSRINDIRQGLSPPRDTKMMVHDVLLNCVQIESAHAEQSISRKCVTYDVPISRQEKMESEDGISRKSRANDVQTSIQGLSPPRDTKMMVHDVLLNCVQIESAHAEQGISNKSVTYDVPISRQEKMESDDVEDGISRKSKANDVPTSIQDKMESAHVEQGISRKSKTNNVPTITQDKMETAHVEPRISRKGDVPTSSACLSNFTEFARGLKDDSNDDDDELESAISPAYEIVFNHKVKTEIAPLIRAMFEKYGDITSKSNVKSPEIISFMLERLCEVYTNLEQRRLHNITNGEINKMMDELRFLEAHKVNISWLLDKLQQISETKSQFQKYLMAKDEEAECNACCEEIDKAIEGHRRQILLIEKKIAEGEINKAEKKTKANKCKQMALDIKRYLPNVKEVKNQSLVHGLL